MPALVVLAAGLSQRYGTAGPALKQLDPVGPGGEWLMEYAIADALAAGCNRVVLITRPALERALADRLAQWPVPVRVVFQSTESLPPGRRKPWGTAHAVLALKGTGAGPYLVVNADDFYGRECFTALAGWVDRVPPGVEPPEAAVAGYRLRDTLSPSGGVSRAVCESDGRWLTRLTELSGIRETATGFGGRDEEGRVVDLGGDDPVSMNAWALTDPVLALLEQAFERFLERHGQSPDREFRLSTVVNSLIAARAMRVEIVPTAARWVGLTHPGDRPRVVAHLQALVDQGRYPSPLFERA